MACLTLYCRGVYGFLRQVEMSGAGGQPEGSKAMLAVMGGIKGTYPLFGRQGVNTTVR